MKSATFEEVVSDQTSKYTKIPKEEYLPAGKYKIIDQGQQFIGGYTNRKDLINASNLPVIVFGDHTKIFKFIDFPFTIGADGTKVLSVKRELADTKYVYYFLKSLKLPVAGYSRHFKFLKGKRIPLPQINDQIHIANVLSRCEELMCKRKESLRLLDEFLKSTFLEMFGDPVRNEKGWDKKKLEDLVAEDCPITYGIVQPGEEEPSGIPIVRPVDLVETTIVRDALKRIDPKVSAKFKRTILKGNEILICVRGTTGKLAFATAQLKGCNVTRGITPIWFPDSYNSVFAFSLLDFPTINMEIQKLTYGATLKQINLRDLREIMLINPPIDLQRKYASIFATVDSIRTQYQSSLKQLTNLFGSLNQRAFRYPTNSKSLPIRIKAQTHLEHEQSA